MSSSREAGVFATRMALTQFKTKRAGAQKGYDLLKRKADALNARFRKMLKDIKDAKLALGEEVKKCLFTVTEANYAAPKFTRKVCDAPQNARVRLQASTDNIAGVKLVQYDIHNIDGAEDLSDSLGLAAGGRTIQKCRAKFAELLRICVRTSNLQLAFTQLDDAIKLVNRRVNALDNVVLPKVKNTIKYIEGELDEIEREEIFRIKKVIEVKRKHSLEEAEALAAHEASQGPRPHQAAEQKLDSLADGTNMMPAMVESTEEDAFASLIPAENE